jgi:hypothetical protein
LQGAADESFGRGSQDEAFLPTKILETLGRHKVSFVVIGGLAARAHGSPTLTEDLDICYERSRSNYLALASALRELGATLRGVDPGLPVQFDAKTIELGDSFTLRTTAGNLDLLGTPSGTTGFADLVRKAVDVPVGPSVVKVTALDDLIRMKRAAGRAKDRIELEILGALRDEIDQE